MPSSAPSGPLVVPPTAPPGRQVPGRPRRSRWIPRALAVATAAAALVLTACSSSSEPDGPTAEESARVVVAGFGLEDSVEPCLVDAFERDGATDALGQGGDADPEVRQRFQDALTGCISAEAFGDVMADSVQMAFPGTSAESIDCVRRFVVDLPEERRDVLIVGAALAGDGTPDELDAELGAVTSEVFTACDVDLASAGGGPTGTTTPPSAEGQGSAASTP